SLYTFVKGFLPSGLLSVPSRKTQRFFFVIGPSLRGTVTARYRGASANNCLCVAEKAPVRGAARAAVQTFMRKRQGNIPLAGAHGRLGQGPVHDVALRVAAADLPEIETNRQQQLDRLNVGAAVKRHEALDHRNADR